MRIGYVLQDPSRRFLTGLDTYTRCLWDALRALGSEHELVPVVLPRRFAARAYSRALWEQCVLPVWAQRKRIDVLHVPAGSAPVVRFQPCVLTLHDLGDDVTQGYRTPPGPRLYFGRMVPWSTRFASALITDSESTKRAAVQRLAIPAERITVVPLAPAPAFRVLPPEAVDEVRRKYRLSDRYFLHVGALIARKNVGGALTGFARLLAQQAEGDLQFVVAGGGSAPALSPEARTLVAEGRVRFLGHVPEDDLVALYNGTLAVVLASFYEGFGFPLVEAFACGTPAIASRVASLPEVGGEAALYVDPHDPDTIADAMARFVASPDFRQQMAQRALERSRRFSWRRTAEATLAVYQRAAGAQGARPGSARPAASVDTSTPKVLFLRLDSLGDLVLTTPCFQALKRRYPGAQLDVLVQPATAPLLENDPNVDRVLTLTPLWRGPLRPGTKRGSLGLLRKLRRERYDYVIVPRRDLDDALFARLCGGRKTIGFYARRTRLFLSQGVRFEPGRHVVENQLQLMELLDCHDEGLLPSLSCTAGDPPRIEALLGPAACERPIGIAPFASQEAKGCDAAQAAALIDALASAIRAPIVLLGSAADRERADALVAQAAAPVVDLAGRTSIPELCDVLRRCRLLVCVDSGPMHLAAALGVPTVALFADEDTAQWGPYGGAPSCVLRMRGQDGAPLTSGEVLAAVRSLLEQTRSRHDVRRKAEVA